jgi:8-oxo-dGTP pyrophosphatase MutT (NUDIX family)
MTPKGPEVATSENGRRRLGLGERATWVRHLPGRDAAVALPLVHDPEHGPTILVATRAAVNGHTRTRMSHAGDTVLLGGALEPAESPAHAALRELLEESGTLGLLEERDFAVRASLGRWVTESGFVVDGFLVRTPPRFASVARPDPREVHELVSIRIDDVYAARPHLAHHRVHVADRAGVTGPPATGDWWFESPTLLVRDVRGTPRALWGAAGHMVHRLRELFPTPDVLLAAG